MSKFGDFLKSIFYQKHDDGSASGLFGWLNPKTWSNTAKGLIYDNDVLPGQERSLSDAVGDAFGIDGLSGLFRALTNRITATELTGAEREQNAFNAQQAELDRQFQADMSNTAFQRGVADMRAAGVNPALAIGQGGASTPSGSAASGSGSAAFSSMSDLMQLAMLKPTIEQMQVQNKVLEQNADTARFDAQTKRESVNIERGRLENEQTRTGIQELLAQNTLRLGENTIRLTDEQIKSIHQDIKESDSRINLQGIEALAKQLDYQFNVDTFEDRKSIIAQELLYRAVATSNLSHLTSYYDALTGESNKRSEGLSYENVSAKLAAEWREQNPGLAKGLEIAGIGSDALGNLLHVNVGFGRSRSRSAVAVHSRSYSESISDVTTHKGK